MNKEKEKIDKQNSKKSSLKKSVKKKSEKGVNSSAKLKKELEEAKDKHVRLFAEYENFRRRTAKERLSLEKTVLGKFMESILPVIDDFERGNLNIENSDKETIIKGQELIFQKLTNILKIKGLKPMDIKAGDDFDSDFHESVAKIPAPEEKLKGKIVDVIEKGYYIDDEIVRHAKVVVGE